MDIINPLTLIVFFIGLGITTLFTYNHAIEKHLHKKWIYSLCSITLILFVLSYILSKLFWGEEFEKVILPNKFIWYFILFSVSIPFSLSKKNLVFYLLLCNSVFFWLQLSWDGKLLFLF